MASSFSSSSGSGMMERDEASPNYLHLPLKEFLECFPPPQSGRMIDGYYPDFDDDTFNIKPGTILNFHRQVSPNVPLSFKDPWGGGKANNLVKVTLPLEFQGRFKLLPYDPDSEDMDADHVYKTAEDLLRAFPVYVQANASYRSKSDEESGDNDITDWQQHLGECSFQCGDRLKLIRLVHKYGQKVIECRLLEEARLMLLPMDCVGNFTVVPDDNEYMLTDLLSMLPRKRRLQIADSTRKQHKIPGVPADFEGDLYLEEPEAFVEASPVDDPGLILGLPNTLDVNIAPEENAFERGQLLNTFATNNRNLFPVVARVTDWDEETTILENHFVRPGIELVIHGWTRQSKILAIAGDKYYAIPLTYQGKFRIKPQQFHGAADLENAHPAYKIRVVDIDQNDLNTAIAPGDVLRIIRQDSLHRNAKGTERGQYLKCEKIEGIGRGREIRIPLTSNARFEEVLEDSKSDDYAIRELVTFVTDTEELVVDLLQGSLDQKVDDRDLPLNGLPITLCDFIVEPAVYVSVETAEAPAFHIPLRTLIYVTFIQQLEKASSPLLTKQSPRLSTLDRCVEILPHDVFTALRPQGDRSAAGLTQAFRNIPTTPMSNWDKRDQTSTIPDSASTTAGFDFETSANRDKNQLRMVHSFAQSKKWTPHYGIDDSESQLSFAGKADYGTKPKGFAAKVKNKFRRHKSTENLRPGSPELSVASGGQRPKSQQLDYLARYDSVDVSAPPPMVVHPTLRLVSNAHVARSGPPSVVSSVRSVSRRAAREQQQTVPIANQGGMMIGSGQQLLPVMQPGGGYMMVPVQPGGMGGYMMMPTMPQPVQSMGGYMMVPIMQPQQQQMMQTSNLVHKHQSTKSSNSSSSIEDEEVESASVDYSEVNFNKSKQFKVAIPSNGNLYHFSAKKMADFFRQLKVSEDCVRACLKEKVDGKKFSKMTESDLERLGLMHPVVVHFRRSTYKRAPNFML